MIGEFILYPGLKDIVWPYHRKPQHQSFNEDITKNNNLNQKYFCITTLPM